MNDLHLVYSVKRGPDQPNGLPVSWYVNQTDPAGFVIVMCNTTSKHYATMIADALNAYHAPAVDVAQLRDQLAELETQRDDNRHVMAAQVELIDKLRAQLKEVTPMK
jgi:hypothetical protein